MFKTYSHCSKSAKNSILPLDLINKYGSIMKTLPPNISRESLLKQLAQTPLFSGISEPDLEQLLNYAIPTRLNADSYFFHQGTPAQHVYILLEGQLKVCQLTPEGNQVVMRMVDPIEIFGCVAALSGGEYPGSALSTKPCEALALAHGDILRLMGRFPQLAINAFQIMVKRTHELQNRYLELATEPVEKRLSHALLRLLEKNGVQTDKGMLLDLPLSRQDLAEMVGSTLYTISRILSAWEGKGIVISGREQLTLLDLDYLKNLAQE
jgi:CRP/FNR family transcriptional regulator, nitrogen oxide reductase regulator